MSDPSVSIVIPCFNGASDLPETLASLERQTFKDFEVIIVDDGSSDPATVSYLQALPPSFRVIRQDNKGLPAARNSGMRAAKGQFLLPLDCDDMLEPSFLEEALAALQRHPDAGFAFTQMRLAGELSGTMRKSYNPFAQLFLNQLPYCLLMRQSAWERLAHDCLTRVHPSGSDFRRPALGGYDESFRSGYEDWEFNIRLSAAGLHGALVDAPLFVYRVRAGGMLNSLSRQRHAQLWRAIQQKHQALYRLRSLWALKRKWQDAPLPYPAVLLFGLLAAHRLLPLSWFNALYARLLNFSAAKRAG